MPDANPTSLKVPSLPSWAAFLRDAAVAGTECFLANNIRGYLYFAKKTSIRPKVSKAEDQRQERRENNLWKRPRVASPMPSNSHGSCISGCGFRQALDRARSSEDGHVDAETRDTLETAIRELWRRIERDPSGYILTRDEFALFNYFRERYRDSALARNAVARFWNSVQSSSWNGAKAKR